MMSSSSGTIRRTRVYLRDLPFDTTEDSLRAVMERCNAKILDLSLRSRRSESDAVT